MWLFGTVAFAGVVATLEVDGDAVRVVRAIQTSSPGTPTDWQAPPQHDPRIRSFLSHDGGEAIRLERAQYRVRLPDGAIPADLPRTEGVAERVHNDAPTHQRLDLLILAEGYTVDEQQEFADDVDALVEELILRTTPFNRYGDLLNVWRVPLVSVDSGASKDTRFETRTADTALSCTYGCGGADRIICCDDEAVFEAADAALPEADALFVLVNDDDYGGAGSFSYSVSFTGEDWLPVAVHELGHVLGDLYDEYDYGFDSAGYGPNCAPIPAFVPWNEWLDVDGIGAWPTCTYSNLYRPRDEGCRMHELEGPFCEVCREALVRELYSHLPPLLEVQDEVSPGERVTATAFGATQIEWFQDGQRFATTDSVNIPSCGVVTVTASDPTDWVRADPDGVMSTSRSWNLGPCPTSCSTAPSSFPSPLSWFARRR